MDLDTLGLERPVEFRGAVAFDDVAVRSHAAHISTICANGKHKRSLDQNVLGRDPFTMTVGERIAAARKLKGWSQQRLADAINQAQTTISSWERNRTEPSRDDVARVAEALGVSAIQLELDTGEAGPLGFEEQPADFSGPPGAPRRIPVIGVVQAGAWAEVKDIEGTAEWVYYDDPEYRRAQLFALVVSGPSMNLVYPDGTRVICAQPHEAGVREGDYVVVQRRRGVLVETTLKQVVIEPDGGIALYPRSTDPAFQEPFRLDVARDADDGATIVGVVVAEYKTRRGGYGPLLEF